MSQFRLDEFAPEDPLALMATGFLGAGVFPTQITANEVGISLMAETRAYLETLGNRELAETLIGGLSTFDVPDEPGSYYFDCQIHPVQMFGTFEVTA